MTAEEIEELARLTAEALRSDPSWWEILAALGPLAVMGGAIVTLWIGLASVRRQRLNTEQQSADNRVAIRERRRADDRAEWWKRAQWALDASMSDSAVRQDLGFKMLNRLIVPGNMDTKDLEILESSWLRTPAGSEGQADKALDERKVKLEALVAQGFIGKDYLLEVGRIMDDKSEEEHNGTDTNRKVSDGVDSPVGPS